MIRRTPENSTDSGDHSEPVEKHFDEKVDEIRENLPDLSEENPIDFLSTSQDTETVMGALPEEEDPLGGRVVDMSEDTSEIIVPEGPSKLEGEVLLVRRVDSEDLPDASGFSVKRVSASREEQQDDKENRGFLYSFLDTVRFISLGLLIGMLLVVFVVQRNDVYGSSMEPTMYDGDAVFVEMISVYLDHYRRGDIVTIDAEGMDGYYHKEYIIKRVIGLPGETVTIFDGLVYINGNLLIEPYLTDGLMTYVPEGGVANGYHQVTLGPDEYYCMGDNRGASNDSRRIGPISVKRIKSHVIARIYPFDEMEIL